MHGKARRDSGHHRARAPTLAPKPRAQGSNTARARLAPSPTQLPSQAMRPLLRLRAAPHATRSIAPKPQRLTARHALGSRPQPHPPRNREVPAPPRAACQASLRCRHAPRASNLQPHLVISAESGHAHIRVHQTSRKNDKEKVDERHRAAVPPSPHEVSERNLGVQGSACVSPAATQGGRGRPLRPRASSPASVA